MRQVLLIARYEYLKFITRRGALIGILVVPLLIGLSIGVPVLTARATQADRFTVIDRSQHGYFDLVAQSLKQDDEHRTRLALNDYVRQYGDIYAIERHAPQTLAMLDAPYGDSQALANFERMGGAKEILATVSPSLKPKAPGFTAPPERWNLVPPPGSLSKAKPAGFASVAKSYLSGTRRDGDPDLRYVVVVPENFGVAPGQEASVEIWRDTPAGNNFTGFIAASFSKELTIQALAPAGLDRQNLMLDLGRTAGIKERSPVDPSGTRAANRDRLKTLVPGLLGYLLMFSVLSNAGMLLGGVIEEKSNRVVELILSCTSSTNFMAGKLLGALGSALTMMGIMTVMAIGVAAAFFPGGLSILSGLGDLPLYVYAAMAIYFVAALLIYSSMYLAMGSMMPSVQDAQSFAAPMMLVVVLPVFFMSAVIAAPNGVIATVLSWIPIYTPFLMMFRLPANPPLFEIVGTAVLIVATTAFMLIQMGRVFAANVLASDKPPTFGAFIQKMAGRSLAVPQHRGGLLSLRQH
ncbi:MAG TPA: ABC transporter permease [Micropepsaceae bacterium]|nr:ABC transporter permease [Micropepsaceae bacterium]